MGQRPSSETIVLVAMSGGVDSSVAAILLHERGYQVMGGMMTLWAEEGGPANRCCSPESELLARQVCRALGVPFHLFDYRAEFKAEVVDRFVTEYAGGRTPNPCLLCNKDIKFGLMLERATRLGADYLATGHYARVRLLASQYQLLKGVDPSKDQSYVLYMLGQEELRRVLLPLGEYSKEQVRAMARDRGLPVADREESQEICFAVGDYRHFLAGQPGVIFERGPIIDEEGTVLGQHSGLPAYTIGQREGLGISAPHPLYVLEIATERNALVVGPRERLARAELTAGEVTFVSGNPPSGTVGISAKIRYRAAEAQATLRYLGAGKARVRFVEPQLAITPGQGVVFCSGDVVMGGGIIEEVG